MKGVHAHRLRRQFGADDAIDARMKWDVRRVSPRDGDQKKYCFTQGWPYGGVFLSQPPDIRRYPSTDRHTVSTTSPCNLSKIKCTQSRILACPVWQRTRWGYHGIWGCGRDCRKVLFYGRILGVNWRI